MFFKNLSFLPSVKLTFIGTHECLWIESLNLSMDLFKSKLVPYFWLVKIWSWDNSFNLILEFSFLFSTFKVYYLELFSFKLKWFWWVPLSLLSLALSLNSCFTLLRSLRCGYPWFSLKRAVFVSLFMFMVIKHRFLNF